MQQLNSVEGRASGVERRASRVERRCERGFTLLEVIIATGIFMMIVVSLLGLSQIGARGIVSLWNDSYVQTAIVDAKNLIEQTPCNQIISLNNQLIIKVGRKEIVVTVQKNMEETLSGKIMWEIVVGVQASRRKIEWQVVRLCP